MTDAPLPKQELLLKLLRMTTSDNDPEALAAIRRANALLTSNNWTWDKLIEGKITVVADPFANIPEPTHVPRPAPSRPAPPPMAAAPRPHVYQKPYVPAKPRQGRRKTSLFDLA